LLSQHHLTKFKCNKISIS